MTTVQPSVLQTVAWHRRERVAEYVTVSHVADFYRRYPGEDVTFFTRLDALADLSELSLRLDIPAGLQVKDFRVPDAVQAHVPQVQEVGDGVCMTWHIQQAMAKGTRWEFVVFATVKQNAAYGDVDVRLDCAAEAHIRTQAGEQSDINTSIDIAIGPKGHYLKYLPSIYREDELMGRFLMLFESFWAPIESQITDIHYYFDPHMTPEPILPWLATWADLVLDQRWPEAKQRQLLRSIVSLYRRRGTRRGLEEMLEIYTGVKPLIMEHRANNLTLGPSAHLGPSIALGKGNVPYTFTVTLKLPPVAPEEEQKEHPDEVARMDAERRRVIESIIESEKPAHTRYMLRIEQA